MAPSRKMRKGSKVTQRKRIVGGNGDKKRKLENDSIQTLQETYIFEMNDLRKRLNILESEKLKIQTEIDTIRKQLKISENNTFGSVGRIAMGRKPTEGAPVWFDDDRDDDSNMIR